MTMSETQGSETEIMNKLKKTVALQAESGAEVFFSKLQSDLNLRA